MKKGDIMSEPIELPVPDFNPDGPPPPPADEIE